ncbi:AcrR family transcriptional regulator [Streptomyces olivoverticillatus]|uniref:AcrR family transcriptional regulator n=1 Tax=Streptomyces olivoverticillatus TaxID=66427 RepID=A0A7W7PJ07_9ACTN|nr:TetR/AcrR family transcriptional regulator [Streptomyces olivoverticillatus]MBB4892656.1 AcrR family transcriptional regulator [Streptomyces olivoverticillatus]
MSKSGFSGQRTPALRADARRNREALIAAARELFAEQGLETPLDDIARRAGVGNATLYRRFATREELIEAVFHDLLDEGLRTGEEARRGEDAWSALVGYMEGIFEGLAANRGAIELMTTAVPAGPTLAELRRHNHETVSELVRRAQEQGAMRADVTAEDLLFGLAALGRCVPSAAAVVPGSWRRHLALLFDGLRAEAARPLPAPPLTFRQLEDALADMAAPRGRAPQG